MADVGVIATFKTAIEGIQALKSLTDIVEIRARTSELYDVIVMGQQRAFEASIKQQAMADEIGELKEKLRKVETWEAEKKRYKLHKFRDGHLAYALKEEATNDEPSHYLCATCFNNGKKSILHEIPQSGFPPFYKCFEKDHSFSTH